MKETIQKFKNKEINLKESIAKVRGLLAFDKDKVKETEQILYELNGRLLEVREVIKELDIELDKKEG